MTRISDGDTFKAKADDGGEERVRLAGIDAPESDQLYGTNSTEDLQRMVTVGDRVELVQVDRDRYGRLVAKVKAHAVGDVGREMVWLGAAWAYRDFEAGKELGPVEDDAWRERRGLWGELGPSERMPPWEWRRGKGDVCERHQTCKGVSSCGEAEFLESECSTRCHALSRCQASTSFRRRAALPLPLVRKLPWVGFGHLFPR